MLENISEETPETYMHIFREIFRYRLSFRHYQEFFIFSNNDQGIVFFPIVGDRKLIRI